jgi:hypothetical protein
MKMAKITAGLAVCIALLLAAFGAGTASADFGIAAFSSDYRTPLGDPLTQAGSHADVVTRIDFARASYPGGGDGPDGTVRNVEVTLPAGFYGNPEAQPTCSTKEIILGEGYCNPAAQVGVFYYEIAPNFVLPFPVFNMLTPNSQTNVLATVVAGVPVKIVVSVRTDGDYGLTTTTSNINQAIPLPDIKLDLWGVPASPLHDADRCIEFLNCGYPAGVEPRPYLSMPTDCSEPIVTEVRATSWQHSDVWSHKTVDAPPLTGCDKLAFGATLPKARPTTNAADSPSGLEFDLHIPQTEDPEGLSTSHMEKAEVTLPEGLVINPSSANGLGTCSTQQIGLTTPIGAFKPHFDKAVPSCPDSARIGSAEVDTPVFADPLKGSIYVATPYDNPFNSLLALYIVIEGRGLVIKLPGQILPDAKTGQLTTIFDQNPPVTFEDFKLNFFGGALAPLRTPATCGNYSTAGTFTPYSAPESGPPATSSDSYAISAGAGKKACPTSQGARPNTPAFEGGSTAALAGKYRPFVVNLRRDDGSQEFAAVTLSPPAGLVAKLADTAICSDAALASASGKTGAQEKASPSCPAASEIGSVFASAGAGPAPYNTPGKAYLSGPYKGAPLSMAIVTPAVAGPYDLGTIVVKTALYLDPVTAEITAKSDPIPTILKGIPLDVRSVSIRLDKPDFTLNPTSCDPTEVTGSLLTAQGAAAALNNRFQLAECGRLRLKPALKLSLKGGTKRRDYPALTAVLTNRSGDANIASVQVALPHSEFLAQNHIRTVCTRVQWAADACPKGSIYGKVKVETPLLGYPLTGNVYLRSSSNPLPDLVPDLRGPAFQPIRFEAAGKTDSVKGGIRNTFSFVPDVPFTKLTLQLQGGKKGLLQNSRNICAATNKADVKYSAHNGLTYSERPALSVKCKKGKKGKGKPKKGKGGGKH